MVLAFCACSILPVVPVSAGTATTIFSFGGRTPSGHYPYAGLINVKGVLYGTATSGGTAGSGTIYSITPAGKETVLYSFTGPAVSGEPGDGDGGVPIGPLLHIGDAFYGTTYLGGASESGTVFKFSAQGEQIIYSFGRDVYDGRNPEAGLIEAGGALYGTTSVGGINNGGTIFKVTLGGQETILHNFGDCAPSLADGCYPFGSLLFVDGAFLGTTYDGGLGGGGGVVFKLTGTSETILHSFGPDAGGAHPEGGLINVNGVLYGTTYLGGVAPSGALLNAGTVYSITQSGSERLVYTFDKSGNTKADGNFPLGELLYVKGVLYGITLAGGAYGSGTAYALLPNGSAEIVLSSLLGGPRGTLSRVGDKLYGTTYQGGNYNRGSVFSISP